MPLLLPVLSQSLAAVFSGPALSPDAAAGRLASAYAGYAAGGMALGIPWVPTGAEEQRLRLRLRAALVPETGSPVSMASAFTEGVLAFWLTPPVPFGPGVVTVIPGLIGLQTGLAAFFANPLNPSAAVASCVASLLDQATRTVVVVYPVTGPAPLV